MSFPAYPEYEDSGVPWLGHVPAHWKVVQSKRVLQRRKVLNVGMVCKDRLALTMNGVIPRRLDDVDGLQSNDYEGYQIFEPGDLAFKLIDLQNIKTSRVGRVPNRGIMSPAYIRLEPISEEIGGFGYWYFMALYWLQVFNQLGGGVRQTLGADELLTVPFPLPAPDEQRSIAAFLDRETAKIDALVAEQERLIALLKEKRQAVISHAVTKGLDPDAPMRDSGIEWLGEIPAHWELLPLKRKWSVTDCKHVTAEFVDDGFPLASIREVQSKDVQLDSAKCTTEEFFHLLREGERDPRPGDLIFSRNATVGEVAQVTDRHPPFAMGQDVCLLRKLEANLSTGFLQSVLKSAVGTVQMDLLMIGSTFKRINVEEIRTLQVPFPPPTEQTEIAQFAEKARQEAGELIAECVGAKTLLQERRAALISAAVTGKINVHGLIEQHEMEAA